MTKDNETVYTAVGIQITFEQNMNDSSHWSTGQMDMHGYPIYPNVVNAQNDLKEKELRTKHPDLAKAYEEYTILLEKYGFWEKITK